jgi:phage shock protein C|tara:strand:+ start:297 stop:719 length:423 start_codon:yes stop_codon:yes gene_type:complete
MSKPRGQLYRIPNQGKIAGVCAGLAEYFSWETWLVRILVVSGVLFGMPFLIPIYIAGWFILDKAPGSEKVVKASNKSSSDDNISQESIKVKARIWQAGEPPRQAFHDIKRKFRVLERQLRSVEQYVTSSEFTVAREINKL